MKKEQEKGCGVCSIPQNISLKHTVPQAGFITVMNKHSLGGLCSLPAHTTVVPAQTTIILVFFPKLSTNVF